MYYIYILFSLKDKKFYIGYTADLKIKLIEHKQGKVKSTRYRLPIKLLCYEVYGYKIEAMKREKFLKSSDGKKDLRRRLTVSLGSLNC
ncbi:GIY-YIG nuclease family protein [Patescibacteria group bacterium]|nr:GIY-YIG nuclease family protein [Patescibacteria group bacterium]